MMIIKSQKPAIPQLSYFWSNTYNRSNTAYSKSTIIAMYLHFFCM